MGAQVLHHVGVFPLGDVLREIGRARPQHVAGGGENVERPEVRPLVALLAAGKGRSRRGRRLAEELDAVAAQLLGAGDDGGHLAPARGDGLLLAVVARLSSRHERDRVGHGRQRRGQVGVALTVAGHALAQEARHRSERLRAVGDVRHAADRPAARHPAALAKVSDVPERREES